ncbi:aspartyl protease family protein 1 [Ricinus communis]|uniref:Aspartic proteinase nepenthesin-1, putative n=1 Tax=Ricinus communis TaxID=3988 RepID=B9T719_RICCO|nr:aspartyl protease family protein 1 [Ricinus communis]EEF28342.1 Aspartic proteinase nepenthesin-1 precursor, putative [Ricinus communis]|eukprot:XP_002534038.1 aspartyl protease family protein 1 [Ricinus communis]
MASSSSSYCSCYNNYCYYSSFLLLLVLMLSSSSFSYGFGTFGFDLHHRYSDPVKGMLSVDDLPEKGSLHYYASMAHRDILIHGRKLVSDNTSTPLTFFSGNETYRFSSLGFLHYANVSIGTPSLSYLVALDTGSDLFWLPCDCTNSGCVQGLQFPSGEQIDFNIYRPNASSTSQTIPCNNTLCSRQSRCPSAQSTCPYQVQYLSNGTSSTGVLVEDLLHLTTDDAQSRALDAKIIFGCGRVQTGSFLDGAAPNGLFGLGMTNISVPSTLAREGYTSNSFSMCFGRDGIGRISFGDTGSSGQGETPFNLRQLHPTYNVSITKINVGGRDADLEFSAIFDSGTSFTYLNDPAYTLISESFNIGAKEKRYSSISDIPFEYCYEMSSNQTNLEIPTVNLVMQGGSQFNVTDPIVIVILQGGASIYCLAIVKSGDVNIIGQNFMTGYRIVFNRERNVLGWKASDCYDDMDTTTFPVDPISPGIPPATAVNPQATAGSGNTTEVSGTPPPVGNNAPKLPKLNSLTFAIIMVLIPFFTIV